MNEEVEDYIYKLIQYMEIDADEDEKWRYCYSMIEHSINHRNPKYYHENQFQ